MELRHCRYFVAVAEELHFGRAARRLSISQPPLSQQIQDLERDLGVELFKRTRRSVRLTPAGEVFLQSARKLLRSVEDSMEVTRRAARGEVGTIRVGYAPGVEIEILPRVLQAFTRGFPEVDVKLVALHSRDQQDALKQGHIDVALILLPGPADGLVVRPLRKEPLLLVLPLGHPLIRKRRVTLRDLDSVPYVHLARSYEPLYHDHILGLGRAARVTLRVVAESGHLYDNLSLIAAGVGVSLLPAAVRRIRRAGLAYRLLRNPGHSISIGVAHRPREIAQPTLAFLEILRRSCSR